MSPTAGRRWTATRLPARRSSRCPAPPTGTSRSQGFRALETRTGTRLADLAAEHEGKQITFADTQARPDAGDHLARSGPDRRPAGGATRAFVINVERLKPWHTLTGRQHFFLDHDWMAELGEQLPVFRPPLDMHRAVRRTGDSAATGRARGRGALPHAALEVVDPLGVPGQPVHALALPRRADDLDEPAGRGEDRRRATTTGSRRSTATASSSPAPSSRTACRRAPSTCTTRRTGSIDVPLAETSGKRGGIHNSLTRLLIKPSHLIGGYAQLSFAFNYLGPTGNQRDEVTVIRRRSQEVEY